MVMTIIPQDSHISMNHIADLIHSAHPDMYIVNLHVGEGKEKSLEPLWVQIQQACNIINNDPILMHSESGFTLFGVSQGGVIMRGVLESCTHGKARTFISMYGYVSMVVVVIIPRPQGGYFGVPKWNTDCSRFLGNNSICKLPEDVIETMIFSDVLQNKLSIAGYVYVDCLDYSRRFWKDSRHMDLFYHKSSVLGHLDNMHVDKDNNRVFNETFKQNMMALDSLVLVHSLIDDIIVPRESTMWSFYADNSTSILVSLRESILYKEDLIGLRYLMSYYGHDVLEHSTRRTPFAWLRHHVRMSTIIPPILTSFSLKM